MIDASKWPFARVPMALLTVPASELTDGAKVTYAILLYWGRTDGDVYVKREKIEAARGTKPSTLRGHLSKLEKAGWVRRSPSGIEVFERQQNSASLDIERQISSGAPANERQQTSEALEIERSARNRAPDNERTASEMAPPAQNLALDRQQDSAQPPDFERTLEVDTNQKPEVETFQSEARVGVPDHARVGEVAADLLKAYPAGRDSSGWTWESSPAQVATQLEQVIARGGKLDDVLAAAKAWPDRRQNKSLVNWLREDAWQRVPRKVEEPEAITLRDDALADALRLLAAECEGGQRLGFGAGLAGDAAKADSAAWFTPKRNAKLHEFADGAWQEWRPRGTPNVRGSTRPNAKQQRIKAAVDLVKSRCPAAAKEPKNESHQDPHASYASQIPTKGVPQ